jgi:hypothetical protein
MQYKSGQKWWDRLELEGDVVLAEQGLQRELTSLFTCVQRARCPRLRDHDGSTHTHTHTPWQEEEKEPKHNGLY